MQPARIAIIGAGVVFSFLCGLAFDIGNIPLAWILGPLFGTAVFAMAGQPVFASTMGRRGGQWIVGTALGLNITAGVLAAGLPWVPAMILCAAVAVVVAAAIAIPYAIATRITYPTAFFAMMPGGLSEMATLGAKAGAEMEPIAVSQSLRVALLVCTFPPVILHFGHAVRNSALLSNAQLDPVHTITALGFGLVGVGALRLLRFRNPWVVGAIAGAGVGTSLGLVSGHLHPWLYAAGQFFIGLTIGARFKRSIILRLGRLMSFSAVATLTLAAILIGLAALWWRLFGLDFITLVLATAPGGMTELSIAAQSLGLPITMIIAFHVVRSVMVNGFAENFLEMIYKTGLLKRLDPWLRDRAK